MDLLTVIEVPAQAEVMGDDLRVIPAELRVGDRVVGFANRACEQRRRSTRFGEYPVIAVEDGYVYVTILGERRSWMWIHDRTQWVWIRARGAQP